MRYHTSDMNGKFKAIDLLPFLYLGVRGKIPNNSIQKVLQFTPTTFNMFLSAFKSSVMGVVRVRCGG